MDPVDRRRGVRPNGARKRLQLAKGIMEPSNVLSTLTVKELYRAFNTADSTAIVPWQQKALRDWEDGDT